jgi:4-amino-4-deoxy-L-arabinose transferase-like glycosyltransferase
MNNFRKKHPYIFLSLLFLALYLLGNQLLAITDTAESNYAETAKEMVLSGNWISPQIYGHYWYDKPIFYYWELALSFKLFGFNEMAARLPAAILGVASVCFTYWFASRVWNERMGWLSAIILGSSLECWLLSKAVITDTTLFLFMSAAIAFFYLGYAENRKYYYGCYIAAALAVLTKGPVGLVLPGLAALLFLAYRRDLKEMAHVHFFSGMLLFLVIAGSWYGLMYSIHGFDFILNFFGVHNFLRSTVPEHPSKNVWYFYVIVYFIGFAPWSFVAPWYLYKRWRAHTLSFREADPSTQLLIVYAATVCIFFEIVATKYTTYTFPALFALSILTAILVKDTKFPAIKTAAGALVVYSVICLTIAPGIMLSRSGKSVGTVLAQMNTGDAPICFVRGYRTSAVFYSGKTLYRLAEADEIDELKPGKLNWKAKNVMPFMTIEQATANPKTIYIVSDDNIKSPHMWSRIKASMNRIDVPHQYSLLIPNDAVPQKS